MEYLLSIKTPLLGSCALLFAFKYLDRTFPANLALLAGILESFAAIANFIWRQSLVPKLISCP